LSDKGQRLAFQIATWACFVTAALHLAGQIAGPQPPANDTERTLAQLYTTYRYDVMGMQRTLEDFMSGFGLVYSLFLATLGGLGLVALRRRDAVALHAFARIGALSSGVLLAISIRHFVPPPIVCALVIFLGYATSWLFGRQASD
jgi:hypothetical protein